MSVPDLRDDQPAKCPFPMKKLPVELGHMFMTLFFGYASYVQLNDPDSAFWIAIYGTTCLTCFLAAVLGSKHSLPRMVFPALSAISLFFLLQQHPRYEFNLKTEIGRESGGLAIVFAWSILSTMSISPTLSYVVIGLSIAIAASAVVIPKYFLEKSDAVDHCLGLGFAPLH